MLNKCARVKNKEHIPKNVPSIWNAFILLFNSVQDKWQGNVKLEVAIIAFLYILTLISFQH